MGVVFTVHHQQTDGSAGATIDRVVFLQAHS